MIKRNIETRLLNKFVAE